jgi:dephospho-CoA kinase
MLRVGLTGGLGSGKSAVALVWADAGIPVIDADALGRALMEPGQAVHAAIVAAFGPDVVSADGALDRAALAREAFGGNRLAELNRIVHPAVIEAQQQQLARLAAEGRHPVAVVESALIFEASEAPAGESAGREPTAPGWRERFDRIVLVTAPREVRVERYIARVAGPDPSSEEKERLRSDALRRIAAQLPEGWKRERSDYVIENSRTLVLLRREALALLGKLKEQAERS